MPHTAAHLVYLHNSRPASGWLSGRDGVHSSGAGRGALMACVRSDRRRGSVKVTPHQPAHHSRQRERRRRLSCASAVDRRAADGEDDDAERDDGRCLPGAESSRNLYHHKLRACALCCIKSFFVIFRKKRLAFGFVKSFDVMRARYDLYQIIRRCADSECDRFVLE